MFASKYLFHCSYVCISTGNDRWCSLLLTLICVKMPPKKETTPLTSDHEILLFTLANAALTLFSRTANASFYDLETISSQVNSQFGSISNNFHVNKDLLRISVSMFKHFLTSRFSLKISNVRKRIDVSDIQMKSVVPIPEQITSVDIVYSIRFPTECLVSPDTPLEILSAMIFETYQLLVKFGGYSHTGSLRNSLNDVVSFEMLLESWKETHQLKLQLLEIK